MISTDILVIPWVYWPPIFAWSVRCHWECIAMYTLTLVYHTFSKRQTTCSWFAWGRTLWCILKGDLSQKPYINCRRANTSPSSSTSFNENEAYRSNRTGTPNFCRSAAILANVQRDGYLISNMYFHIKIPPSQNGQTCHPHFSWPPEANTYPNNPNREWIWVFGRCSASISGVEQLPKWT
jgi:hypothetical protein